MTGRTFRKSLEVKWCDGEISNWLLHIFHWVQRHTLEPAETKYQAKKTICCAKGVTSTGCSQSDEAWDVKTGREAALPHEHYLTFSLLRGSALGLGKGGASLQSSLWSEGWNGTASPQLRYYKGTMALPRCRETAAAQWDSALCSAGKEDNTTKQIVPCTGVPWLCCAVRSVIAEATLRGWEAEDGGHTLLLVWGTEQERG